MFIKRIDMPSEAQIKANRKNARKSTGPKSQEGKNKVAKNAISHGVFADTPLLPHENEEEFGALCENIAQVFPPTDAYAAGLVERIIMCIWRQRRLRSAEAAKLNISSMPESYVNEINVALHIPYNKLLTATDIGEAQEANYQYFLSIQEEFKKINIKVVPEHLDEFKKLTPNAYKQLELAAGDTEHSWDDFIKDHQLVIQTLTKIKQNVNKWLKDSEHMHAGYEVAQHMKMAKLVPMGSNLDFLSKYQTQLDTDLYRAIDAYKRHVDWREKNIEIEVSSDI